MEKRKEKEAYRFIGDVLVLSEQHSLSWSSTLFSALDMLSFSFPYIICTNSNKKLFFIMRIKYQSVTDLFSKNGKDADL